MSASKTTGKNLTKTNNEFLGLDFSDLGLSRYEVIVLQKLKDYLYSDENFRPRKYSIEQIRRFLENPQTYERQLREVSQYLLIVSSKYFRLIDYFSKMLTLDYIIVPIGITEEEMNSDKFKKNYLKVVNYMEQFNVKHEIRKILEVILSEDIFFGYERNQGTDEFMIQRLPTNYCKLYSIERGVLNFAFNFSYFDTRKKELENYPSEFSEMYSEYIETGNNWMVLDGNKSVCFKLRETYPYSIPVFSGAFEDLLDLDDTKDLIKTKLRLENFMLLQQKIPFKKEPKSEKDMLIGLDSVKMFHANIKANLPSSVSVVSTPMDLEAISFERRRDDVDNNVQFMKNNFYDSVGVSGAMFNSDTKNMVSVNRGINVDESMMFGFLRQLERYFKKKLSKISSNQYSFKAYFPDITVYNRKELSDFYSKNATFGFPKILVAACMGLSMADLESMTYLENSLGLVDKMVPLKSSHTSIGNEDKRGAPQKDDGDLSPEGEKTKVTDGNNK